jgi:hypothetical protein
VANHLRKYGKSLGTVFAVAAFITAVVLRLSPPEQLKNVLWIAGIEIAGVTLILSIIGWIARTLATWRTRRQPSLPQAKVAPWITRLTGFLSRYGVSILLLSLAAVAIGVIETIEAISIVWIAGAGIAIGALLWAIGQTPTNPVGLIDSTSLAKELVKQENRHQREESRRSGALKVVSFVVGVILAYYLKIDAFDFLRGSILSSATISKINRVVLVPGTHFTVGILLTGMAATAGSAFWHEQLDRLQSTKRRAEQAAKTVQQVSERIGTTQDEQT